MPKLFFTKKQRSARKTLAETEILTNNKDFAEAESNQTHQNTLPEVEKSSESLLLQEETETPNIVENPVQIDTNHSVESMPKTSSYNNGFEDTDSSSGHKGCSDTSHELEKTLGNKILIPIEAIKQMAELWIARNPEIADHVRNFKQFFGSALHNTHEMTAMILVMLPLFFLFAFVLAPISSFIAICGYPLLMSMKSVESNNHDTRSRWLVYWLLYNLVHVVDYVFGIMLSIIPGYSLIKFFYLVWCMAPIANNGCAITYTLFLRSLSQIACTQADEFTEFFRSKLPSCLVSKESPFAFETDRSVNYEVQEDMSTEIKNKVRAAINESSEFSEIEQPY